MQPPQAYEREGVGILQEAVRRWGPDTAWYRALGEIRAVLSPDARLILFTYTDKAAYERRWSPVERVSRGLILEVATGDVVARPFPKFYNLGEMPETQLGALAGRSFTAAEKMDGSLGIGYWRDGDWHVATRGSFTSEQAGWATTFLRARTDLCPELPPLPRDLTLLFEVIYPANRVVLDYGGRAELVLIGARRTAEGHDLDPDELRALAVAQRLPEPGWLGERDLARVVDLARYITGCEGWVVRFDDGTRAKVKGAEYLALHKLVSGLTPARVRDAILDGTIMEYIAKLPDEFAHEAEALRREIAERAVRRTDALYAAYEALMVEHRAPRTDGAAAEGPLTAREARKAFALRAQAAAEPADLPFLFHLYERRPIGEAVLKAIDLPQASGLVGRLAGAGAP